MFSGPRPWHLHGDASIHILFFCVSASLDLHLGRQHAGDAAAEAGAARPARRRSQDPRNWSAALPDGAAQAVTLLPPKPDDKTLRVHPMGTLSVRENVVPLDLPITRYGNADALRRQSLRDQRRADQRQDESRSRPFQDYFAAGQFLTLSDADKLSRPSFETYDAGVTHRLGRRSSQRRRFAAHGRLRGALHRRADTASRASRASMPCRRSFIWR